MTGIQDLSLNNVMDTCVRYAINCRNTLTEMNRISSGRSVRRFDFFTGRRSLIRRYAHENRSPAIEQAITRIMIMALALSGHVAVGAGILLFSDSDEAVAGSENKYPDTMIPGQNSN